MLHLISEKIAYLISDKDDVYPIEIYTYGVELMLSSLIWTTLIVFMGIIFNLFVESLIFAFSLSFIRFFSGGYHAKSYLKCNLISFISYSLSVIMYEIHLKYLLKYSILILLIIIIISVLILLLFSPVENKNKKIDDIQKNKFKLISICVVLFEGLGCLFLFDIFQWYGGLILLPTIIVVDASIVVQVLLEHIHTLKQHKKL